MRRIMKPASTLFAMCLLLPFIGAGSVHAQVNQECAAPQLDTQIGCVWPEQLGLRIEVGVPLGGVAILTLLSPSEVGKHPPEGQGYYRVARSSLVLALEGDELIVRDMFYLPR